MIKRISSESCNLLNMTAARLTHTDYPINPYSGQNQADNFRNNFVEGENV